MGQHSLTFQKASTLIQKAFVVATLFEIGMATPVDGNMTAANPSDERNMMVASLIGVLSVMLVLVFSILLCMIRLMDDECYATRIISIHSRATTSTIYRDATDKDQDTNGLREQDKNSVRVVDLSRNSNLPLSKDRLPRYPTTLDFGARDPLIASPNSIDAITRSEPETHMTDAGNADSNASETLTSSFHIPPFLAAQDTGCRPAA